MNSADATLCVCVRACASLCLCVDVCMYVCSWTPRLTSGASASSWGSDGVTLCVCEYIYIYIRVCVCVQEAVSDGCLLLSSSVTEAVALQKESCRRFGFWQGNNKALQQERGVWGPAGAIARISQAPAGQWWVLTGIWWGMADRRRGPLELRGPARTRLRGALAGCRGPEAQYS